MFRERMKLALAFLMGAGYVLAINYSHYVLNLPPGVDIAPLAIPLVLLTILYTIIMTCGMLAFIYLFLNDICGILAFIYLFLNDIWEKEYTESITEENVDDRH